MLKKHLQQLAKMSGGALKKQRYEKFRAMGQFVEAAAEPPRTETAGAPAK